ncbi:MAG: LytTR family transcriptional regulator [Saprospiraceae bacterium]|nr:LytTR family transcriptional regulator [Saprospiraceae bacterium]
MNAKVINIQQPKAEETGALVSKNQKRKLAIPTSNGIEVIATDQIVYLKSSSNYTNVHLACGRHMLVSKTLKRFEKVLKGRAFIRIHHSYMINIDFFEKTDNNRVFIQGIHLPISKERKKFLNATLRSNFIYL